MQVEILKDLIPEKYPHYMERGEFCTYKSSSILGQIHDEVDAFNNFDPIQGQFSVYLDDEWHVFSIVFPLQLCLWG